MRQYTNHVPAAIGAPSADFTLGHEAQQPRINAITLSTMNEQSKRRNVSAYLKAIAALGPGWAIRRAKLHLLNRLGVVERRTPLRPWSSISLSEVLRPGIPQQAEQYLEWRRANSPPFFSKASSIPAAYIGEGSQRVADGILAGEIPFFGSSLHLGFPPNWQRDPTTGRQATGGHWTKIDEFGAGDVKLWWEASRFTWVFALSRAFGRTADERYAHAYWQLISDWMDHNPPNRGINWKCGQEASFRVMALCFGFYAFLSAESTSPQNVERFTILIHALGQRIDAYIEYAQSQKNNHGISEGTGLWTIGLLFPEFEAAERWRRRGKQLITSEVIRQIYDDGSYIQHSINYHRVMLQDLCWALRLGECNADRLSDDIYDRFRKGARFLHQFTDSSSGLAPNYGANDGALVTPLTDCAFSDMRPVLQSCHYLTEKTRLYQRGEWDEEMTWLHGAEAVDAPLAPHTPSSAGFAAESGGYYTIGTGESWAMIRAAQYKDRPSHADQLHFDLWWKGENVLRDAGTYSYNSPIPFEHALASTRYHNTVTIDGEDQMTRVSRFLWADWASATVLDCGSEVEDLVQFQAEHSGYAKAGVIHRRAVIHPDDFTWIVVDDLSGRGKHTACLRWLAPDVPVDPGPGGALDMSLSVGKVKLILAASAGDHTFDVVRAGIRVIGQSTAELDTARGWESRYYGRKDPALSIALESCSELPLRLVTVILLGNESDVRVDPSLRTLVVGAISINLSAIGESPIKAQR